MSDREIKVWDRVRHKEFKYEGVVVFKWGTLNKVQLQDGTLTALNSRDLEIVTPIDKRTEFLGRLQSLLKEYDACVIPRCAVSGTYERGLRLMVGNDEIVYRSRNELNADNIMDFEKE